MVTLTEPKDLDETGDQTKNPGVEPGVVKYPLKVAW